MRVTFRMFKLFLMAMMLFSVALPAESARHAKILSLQGEVSVRPKGGDWQTPSVGMILYEEDEIKTGQEGHASILIDDAGTTGEFEVMGKSHVRLNTLKLNAQTDEKVTLLDLAVGKVLVHAEKLKGDSKFEVRTPTSAAGVRGTLFEVTVEDKKESEKTKS